METGSYESSDPERYDLALSLVDEFEDLPESDGKELIFTRARALSLGAQPDGSDSMGMVEAIAQAMQESKEPQQQIPS
jgi:hypothetical protein